MKIDLQKITKQRSPSVIFFFAILLFDVLLLILAGLGYYIQLFKPSGILIPVLLTLIAFYVFARKQRIKPLWVVLVTLLVLPLLGFTGLKHAFLANSYDTVENPLGSEALVIEHREATLGETTHFYHFYRSTLFPGVMKEIKRVNIMTRGTHASNLKVLGINHVNWVDGEYILFRSPYAVTKVPLNNSQNIHSEEEAKVYEKFVPLETDVIQIGDTVKQEANMKEFFRHAKKEEESEVRYIVFGNKDEPMAVYTLKSRTDQAAGQSWIEISRDYSFDSKGYEPIKSQQCGSISKDSQRGAYYLNKCFHKWEIRLMPITGEQH